MNGISNLAKHLLSVSCIIGIKLPVKVVAEESSILQGATLIDSINGLSSSFHDIDGCISSAFGAFTINTVSASPNEIRIQLSQAHSIVTVYLNPWRRLSAQSTWFRIGDTAIHIGDSN